MPDSNSIGFSRRACPHCHKANDRNRGLCSSCMKKDEVRRKKRFSRRVCRGQCPKCCKPHDRSNGNDICEPCLVKSRAGYHDRKKRRAGTGKCPQCNRDLLPNRKRCAICIERTAACRIAIRARRMASGECVRCGSLLDDEKDGRLCGSCRLYYRRRERALKDLVFAAYGGYKCACCGETEKLFLQIDHVNNDGADHRRERKGKGLYTWLKCRNFPEGFQVLCANCNWGKRQNGGVCPHRQKS